ncbi:MAG TPA: YhbY family RNA-binding protein [Casimicrobiaceae bacterium]|nr:YhbY family RNA-binding protein [Casimicrobiaceae bacterium]
MTSLTPPQRRALRAKAHHLHPVVSVGQHGLTAAVLHEIDVNLIAHELVKVRVFNDDRDAREALLKSICAELDAAPVQHIGKLLVVWRPSPEPVKVEVEKPKRAAVRPASGAKRAPQVRRPRSPLPRAPSRPPAGGPSTRKGVGWGPRNSRRRRGTT